MVKQLIIFCDSCGKQVNGDTSKRPDIEVYWNIRPIQSLKDSFNHFDNTTLDFCNNCFEKIKKMIRK